MQRNELPPSHKVLRAPPRSGMSFFIASIHLYGVLTTEFRTPAKTRKAKPSHESSK